ncbi:MaoC/PaaZ C-terminal domain-containing protein [Falsigemmobacter faecalis]|uniref:3-alpha,7-alpha, 12-alpha-trihydroxy-5-beta-cholest-24-enoyl-CoA hydratase n=1 Tax=Falsigemmobacter faecalis TaxID=2488730 RepID=A0A3P3DW25_9RHOB|nr:MaoC/PaaZ C-terminal domain-containing protein [Falsigemmobacter faecalis]RRH78194.1 3-alpha,7-alpha,12-alpha-trihydroxy-5-beta-cholest-24-enoyl-CoA hydratase [Falsigemmobacter faecalis]
MSRYDALLALDIPALAHRYDVKDVILYALGCGAGAEDLGLVYEKADLRVIPTMATVLAYPGDWYRNLPTGLAAEMIVHASERVEVFDDLPVRGHLTAKPRISAIHDKGPGRGAIVVSERDIREAESGRLLARVTQRAFCRGDGGMGGPQIPLPPPEPLPARASDRVLSLRTSPRAAAIYRLMGDDNPLHIDPAIAREGGFGRPILHGLSGYGHICRALLSVLPPRMRVTAFECRFTAPVLPGDDIALEIWHQDGGFAFRGHARGRTAFDNGTLRYAPCVPEVPPRESGAGQSS